MVAENLAKSPEDPRVSRALEVAAAARGGADRAIALFPVVASAVLS
jgi:hypothetical protein